MTFLTHFGVKSPNAQTPVYTQKYAYALDTHTWLCFLNQVYITALALFPLSQFTKINAEPPLNTTLHCTPLPTPVTCISQMVKMKKHSFTRFTRDSYTRTWPSTGPVWHVTVNHLRFNISISIIKHLKDDWLLARVKTALTRWLRDAFLKFTERKAKAVNTKKREVCHFQTRL